MWKAVSFVIHASLHLYLKVFNLQNKLVAQWEERAKREEKNVWMGYCEYKSFV